MLRYSHAIWLWFEYLIKSPHSTSVPPLDIRFFKCWHSLWSTSFWPPSMAYISMINSFYTLHQTIFQVLTDSCRPLWAAFMYCFKHLPFLTCGYSSKLYSLDCSCSVVLLESSYSIYRQSLKFFIIKFNFSLLIGVASFAFLVISI